MIRILAFSGIASLAMLVLLAPSLQPTGLVRDGSVLLIY